MTKTAARFSIVARAIAVTVLIRLVNRRPTPRGAARPARYGRSSRLR